jgi:hypothetical protein
MKVAIDKAPAFYSGGTVLKSQPRHHMSRLILYDFPQFLQANIWIISYVTSLHFLP